MFVTRGSGYTGSTKLPVLYSRVRHTEEECNVKAPQYFDEPMTVGPRTYPAPEKRTIRRELTA